MNVGPAGGDMSMLGWRHLLLSALAIVLAGVVYARPMPLGAEEAPLPSPVATEAFGHAVSDDPRSGGAVPARPSVRTAQTSTSEEAGDEAAKTGVELSGRSPDETPPKYWSLYDAQTKERQTIVQGKWGFAAAPPGRYLLILEMPGQSKVRYGEFEIGEGEIESVAVNSGVELSGRSPDETPPKYWSLYDAETEERVTYVDGRWGFAAAPPGRYLLILDLYGQNKVRYGEFELGKGEIKSVAVDSGIELAAGTPDEVPPERWRAYDATTGKVINESRGGWGIMPLPAGRYTLEVASDGLRAGTGDAIALAPGTVVKITLADMGLRDTPFAEVVRDRQPVIGFNIALAQLGGKIERTTSPGDGRSVSSENLIDGLSYVMDGRSCRRICGWESVEYGPFPHEFVFSFYKGRRATILAVVFDPKRHESGSYPKEVPQHVEIWASTTSPTEGFQKIAAARVRGDLNEQIVEFPPTPARFVKLRILSNHGGRRTSLGEFKIIEAPGATSILDDAPRDLARPENGGAIVWFTSQNGYAAQLLWQGDWRWKSGWSSAAGPYGTAVYLPQDFVFAFRGDREALVDRLIVDPTGLSLNLSNPYGGGGLARTIAVFVSTESPLDGFEKVGEFTLEPEARAQSFPIGRRARFMKLRILDFQGNAAKISLGKVKLIEGNAPGYVSILRTPASAPEAIRDLSGEVMDETGMLAESEPNDTPPQANPLPIDRWTRGTIDPIGEDDYFRLSIPGDEAATLTMELTGRPHIRTSLTVVDPAGGKTLYSFDPGAETAREQSFSMQVQPGEYLVLVTEPTISMVLVWDTSRSMEGRTDDLRGAVESYLDEVEPTERLNLIAFSKEVEVLLPEFTGDRERLKAATEGRFFANGGTPLYDAIEKAVELLDGAGGNRAIIVMTDGSDTTSKLSHPGLWKLLSEKRIRTYTIGLGHDLLIYDRKFGATGERMLGHVALATNGHAFFARTSAELKGIYQKIAVELRAPSTYYLKPTLSREPGRLSVVLTDKEFTTELLPPPRFELILDASGSMKGKLPNGETKIAAAKNVMNKLIDELPDQSEVALRVYGHRFREYDEEQRDCRDSQLIYAFQKVDKSALKKKVDAIRVKGTTPLSYSLVKAAQDLVDTPGDKIIVLVTDGEEWCGAVPHEVAEKLAALGMKIRIEVVGFALADPKVKEEMIVAAKATGGSFHDAQDPEGLRQSLRRALAPPFEVFDAAGTRVAGGVVNRGPIELPQGLYTVALRAGEAAIEIPHIRVVQKEVTRINLRKQGHEILGPAKANEAAWAAEDAAQPLQTRQARPGAPAAVSGRESMAALKALEADVLAAIVNRPKMGSRSAAPSGPSPRIRYVQQLLARLGFDPGPVDGLWGQKTALAVQAFQKWYPEARLMPSGRLDAGTLAALEDAVAGGRAASQATAAPATTARTTPAPAPAPATTVDLIGEVMDDFDRIMMAQLFNSDPQGQVTLRWSNPASGRAYVAKAQPVLTDSEGSCRAGTVETVFKGRDKTYYYAVCRRAGRWAYRYVTDRPMWLTTQ